jgi:hypothetical protein
MNEGVFRDLADLSRIVRNPTCKVEKVALHDRPRTVRHARARLTDDDSVGPSADRASREDTGRAD